MIDDDQIYIVVDIEADGPAPGLYSMLSIGAVATDKQQDVSHFYRTLLPLEGASQHPRTMAWWQTQQAAWQEVHTDTQPADQVMTAFTDWLHALGKKPVFVAHPIAFDYSFVSWYLLRFTNNNPFYAADDRLSTLDLSSFIAGKLHIPLHQATRDNLPPALRQGMPEHSHNALEDARGYAVILRNALLQ